MSNAYNFEISDTVLRRTCEFNSFSIEGRENEMILFGIRGALPASHDSSIVDYTEHLKFKPSHLLRRVKVDYYYPRCVIGQWLPSEQKVAVFPGSTVPNLKAAQRSNAGKYQFNLMLPGYHSYSKGQHPKSNSGFQPHKALRLSSTITLRRANYQIQNGQPVINYGPSASIFTGNPSDNIHCARNNTRTTKVSSIRGTDYSPLFCMSDYYSSYGCQVIVGCPTEYIPKGQTNGSWNAWDTYIGNVYSNLTTGQDSYKYVLLNSFDVKVAAEANSSDSNLQRVLHGSSGWLVKELQIALKNINDGTTGSSYYQGVADGDFGKKTAEALITYQKDMYGGKAYGFAGRTTLATLGISLAVNI